METVCARPALIAVTALTQDIATAARNDGDRPACALNPRLAT